MKANKLFILLPVLSLLLTGCSGATFDYKDHLKDYVFQMDYHQNFNILQLTDIHWSMNSSTHESKIYMDKVLKETDRHIKELQGNNAKIDLVELTGDMFMLSNAYHVSSFVDYFEAKASEYGFIYTAIWGNHDRHGIYNPNWLGEQFKNAPHCYYYEPEDNLYGRSNFMINLVKGNEVKWQIANLDSGASFSETSISPFRDYDYIRKDQTDWWLKEHTLVGESVPGIAYYHIPQDENTTLYNNRASYKNKFFKLERFADNGNEAYASDFLDVAKEHNLKGAFMGHAHNNDWTVDWDGLVVGLGVKTGQELYYAHIDPNSTDAAMKEGLASVGINEKFDLIGAALVTITDSEDNILGKFDLEHLYYNERTSGDFVRWVKW
ncbi:MAG: hypothetical protein E7181_01800 [Erysipelotrichaceae bacterium]|jgi:predicted MPP superfamily phosphohydrolase|nr:hypothetical protein [Erysipelotrichaceae bacterium]